MVYGMFLEDNIFFSRFFRIFLTISNCIPVHWAQVTGLFSALCLLPLQAGMAPSPGFHPFPVNLSQPSSSLSFPCSSLFQNCLRCCPSYLHHDQPTSPGWRQLCTLSINPARAQSARARRACALRALGLLLYSRKGEDFLTGQLNFFTETAVTPERKVEKSFPRWEINRHAEG